MTNAQKWVAGFLLLFVLLLALSKMTDTEETEHGPMSNTAMQSTNTSSDEINAESILANNRCYICHGRDLSGTGMGPSLAHVKDNWKKPSLISYFQNPQAFLNNQRMVALKDQYNRNMPAFENLSQEELNALADYLLKR